MYKNRHNHSICWIPLNTQRTKFLWIQSSSSLYIFMTNSLQEFENDIQCYILLLRTLFNAAVDVIVLVKERNENHPSSTCHQSTTGLHFFSKHSTKAAFTSGCHNRCCQLPPQATSPSSCWPSIPPSHIPFSTVLPSVIIPPFFQFCTLIVGLASQYCHSLHHNLTTSLFTLSSSSP